MVAIKFGCIGHNALRSKIKKLCNIPLHLLWVWYKHDWKMAYTVKIASLGYHVYKNVNWGNVKADEKVTIEIETSKDLSKLIRTVVRYSYGWKSCQIGHCWPYSHGSFKASLEKLEEKLMDLLSTQNLDLCRFQLEG